MTAAASQKIAPLFHRQITSGPTLVSSNSGVKPSAEVVHPTDSSPSRSHSFQLFLIWSLLAVGACYLCYSAAEENGSFAEIKTTAAKNEMKVRRMNAAMDQIVDQSAQIREMDTRLYKLREHLRRQDRAVRELSVRLTNAQVSQNTRKSAVELNSSELLTTQSHEVVTQGIKLARGKKGDGSPSNGKLYVTAVVVDDEAFRANLSEKSEGTSPTNKDHH